MIRATVTLEELLNDFDTAIREHHEESRGGLDCDYTAEAKKEVLRQRKAILKFVEQEKKRAAKKNPRDRPTGLDDGTR